MPIRRSSSSAACRADYAILALLFPDFYLTRLRHIERKALPQWIAVACVLMALLFAGLESTHIHGSARSGNTGGPCAVCISAHANAPTVAPQSLPVLLTVAIVAVPDEMAGKAVLSDLNLFIRPPPAF